MTITLRHLLPVVFVSAALAGGITFPAAQGRYPDLVKLFTDFLAFERPPLKDGAPDYTAATFVRRRAELKAFQTRLGAIDPGAWPGTQQVDHALVRAQMHGLDFDMRVLRPWARDPAFYQSIRTEQSDTPAHGGPTHHAVVELWTYRFPLAPADEARLAGELGTIPPLLTQARLNLAGNARDLWITGAGTMRNQVADLTALDKETAGAGPDLKRDSRGRHGDLGVCRVARSAGVVEDRAVRRRQSELHVESPERPPRAHDVG